MAALYNPLRTHPHAKDDRMTKTSAGAASRIPPRRLSWMDALLAASAGAILAALLGAPPILVFLLSCAGLIPLAGHLGRATEVLAAHAGPQVGGLLNATLGNAAELIITLVAVREGLLDVVKASITGSIIGNLLLVLGFSLLIGGLRNGVQSFSRETAGRYATLLALAVVALVVPSFFQQSHAAEVDRVEYLSLGVAATMIVIYVLGLVYSLRSREGVLPPAAEPAADRRRESTRAALVRLAAATIGVVVLSEILVGTIGPVVETLGVSEFFVGIVLVPLIGNVAEHLVAIEVARRNQVELSLEIALGSSLQIALFVAPLLVFLSLGLGHPLTLVFHPFETMALTAGVAIAALISLDGRSNWLEGSVLIAVYAILGLAFFLLPV
jgi:Ca2+:H+ antiporter